MFPRLSALAACAAFFLLGAASTGALYVTSLPSGADMWVDGTYIGHSPVVVDALAAGRHAVSLTKAGWAAQDLDVSVVAAATAISSVQLQRDLSRGTRPGDGFIAIKGAAATDVTIDGQRVKPDKAGLYAASSGSHEVAARTRSGKMTREITVYPAMRTDVILRGEETARSAVVAPASDYLPPEAIKIDGARVAIKHQGHNVVATLGSTAYRLDGRSVGFDAAPTLIGSKLYLPLELLTQLTANDKAK